MLCTFKRTNAADNGVYRSTDAGANWTKVIDLSSATCAACLYYDSTADDYYCAWVETNVIKSLISVDDGVNWASLCADLTAGDTQYTVGWFMRSTKLFLQVVEETTAPAASATVFYRDGGGLLEEQVRTSIYATDAFGYYTDLGFVNAADSTYYFFYTTAAGVLTLAKVHGSIALTAIVTFPLYDLYFGQMSAINFRNGLITASFKRIADSTLVYGYTTITGAAFVEITNTFIFQPSDESLSTTAGDYTLAYDWTNGRIVAIDRFTVNIYPIYYNAVLLYQFPILFMKNFILMNDKMYVATKAALPTSICEITQSNMKITLYEDIGVFTTQVLLLYDTADTLLCRFFINSYRHINLIWQLDGYNLNDEVTRKKVTISLTDTFGNILKAGIDECWDSYYSATSIDGTGSSYPYQINAQYISSIINFINNASSGKVYIDPSGCVYFKTGSYVDNGITLSPANNNVKFSTENVGLTGFGYVQLYGGYKNGAQISALVESSTGDRNLPFVAHYPIINDQTLLDAMAQEIMDRQETGLSSILVVYRGTTFMQYGQTCTLDLTAMSAMLEVMGISQTLYINSVKFDPLNELSTIELVTSWLYDNESEDMAILRDEVTSLANDVQTNGNLYQPKINVVRTTDTALTTNTYYQVAFEALVDSVQSRLTWSASTNPSRITIQEAGFYQINATAYFGPNSSGRRIVRVFKNGSSLGNRGVTDVDAAATEMEIEANVAVQLAVDDYIEIGVYATFSSGTLKLNQGTLSMFRGSL